MHRMSPAFLALIVAQLTQAPTTSAHMIVPVDGQHDTAGSAKPVNPMTDAARAAFPEHRKNLIGAFAAMPEDKYGFRPTPELMTFGELAVHIASADFFYCRRLGGPPPSIAFPKPTAAKAQLFQLLEDSLAYCAPVVAGLTDASLALPAQVQRGDAPTRAAVVLDLLSGMDHHYGQAASYLRLNGLVPPTATAGKH